VRFLCSSWRGGIALEFLAGTGNRIKDVKWGVHSYIAR
jgi:hypothetical protein